MVRETELTQHEIRAAVQRGIEQRELCRFYMWYDENYFYYFPLAMSRTLFLGAAEEDFVLNGYSIRRFADIEQVESKEDKYMQILQNEGVVGSVGPVPEIDLTDWGTALACLARMGRNIIVEDESDEEAPQFAIGRIETLYNRFLYFRHFDANGVWESEPMKIPYDTITSVTFGSRYVDVFSKHLPPLPENFGKQMHVIKFGEQ
jgi:hypothetical protein